MSWRRSSIVGPGPSTSSRRRRDGSEVGPQRVGGRAVRPVLRVGQLRAGRAGRASTRSGSDRNVKRAPRPARNADCTSGGSMLTTTMRAYATSNSSCAADRLAQVALLLRAPPAAREQQRERVAAGELRQAPRPPRCGRAGRCRGRSRPARAWRPSVHDFGRLRGPSAERSSNGQMLSAAPTGHAVGHARTFDVIVIGAGPAGEVAAGRLAERGGAPSPSWSASSWAASAASMRACPPRRCCARRSCRARRHASPAWPTGTLDVAAVLARRDEVRQPPRRREAAAVARGPWHHARPRRPAGWTASCASGSATSCSRRARRWIVAPRARRRSLPPIPGLADAAPWTSRDITTASEVPRRLRRLGGGVVGVEMAQAWRALGAEVTIIEAGERLLSREEPFAGEEVAAALAERGVAIRAGVAAARVAREERGRHRRLACRRQRGARRPAARRGRPAPADRRPRPRERRPPAGPGDRGRRHAARPGQAVALRRRRRQRARAADAHGQVPGARGRRPHPRRRERSHRGRRAALRRA